MALAYRQQQPEERDEHLRVPSQAHKRLLDQLPELILPVAQPVDVITACNAMCHVVCCMHQHSARSRWLQNTPAKDQRATFRFGKHCSISFESATGTANIGLGSCQGRQGTQSAKRTSTVGTDNAYCTLSTLAQLAP